MIAKCVPIQLGHTALMKAAGNGHGDVVVELIKAGANCNLQDEVILIIAVMQWWKLEGLNTSRC